MIEIAITGKIIEKASDVSSNNIQSIYDYSYPIIIRALYTGSEPTRPHDININTLANRMKIFN